MGSPYIFRASISQETETHFMLKDIKIKIGQDYHDFVRDHCWIQKSLRLDKHMININQNLSFMAYIVPYFHNNKTKCGLKHLRNINRVK